MYSMLLMVAMSSGAATPVAHCGGGCGNNGGCGSSCNTGCSSGSSCNRGCGGGFGLFGGCGHRRSCGGGCNDYGSCGSAPGKATCAISGGNQATLVLDVPTDAKIFLDSVEAKSTGAAQRRFVTPPLETGENYSYVVRTEIVRDGKTIVETKTVTVRAGEESRASFGASAEVVAAK